MLLTEEIKREIDEMSYRSMLQIWRHAETGHPMITGEIGKYFARRFHDLTQITGHQEKVAASKSVGW